MKLKTLKDIVTCPDCTAITPCKDTEVIRNGAIAWVKSWLNTLKGHKIISINDGGKIIWEFTTDTHEQIEYFNNSNANEFLIGSITAFVKFFNLTEEDLK